MVKVMIVEDDFMIADMAEELLERAGYTVCGIARCLSEAVTLSMDHQPEIVLMDFQLADGETGIDIARGLRRAGRPGILYVTGNADQVMRTGSEGDGCLVKPYRPDELLRSLEVVAELQATGVATPPFPKNLHLLRRGAVPASVA